MKLIFSVLFYAYKSGTEAIKFNTKVIDKHYLRTLATWVFKNMFNDLCPRISSVIIIYKYKIKVDAVANYINMS